MGYPRGISLPGYTRYNAQQALSARARVRERPNVLLQGLEWLVTALLARNRQPPPPVAAGVPHAELAVELASLPSGLLTVVCKAIMKLKVRLGAAWCACVCV
jgi:hypothetical protein